MTCADLRTFLVDLETKFEDKITACLKSFKYEIGVRDSKIATLENEILSLKELHSNDETQYENIIERLNNLENVGTHDKSPVGWSNVNYDNESNNSESNDSESNENEVDEESQISVQEWETLDFVCLGDSLIKWLPVEEINPGHSNKKVCLPGAKIANIRDALDELNNDYNIKNLYLQVGSNEIPDKTPFEVARELTAFLTEIKLYMPDTKLYVSTIIPKIDSSYLPGINEINYLLCGSCNTLGIVLIQHQAFGNRGVINHKLYAYDQIHLNRIGIKYLANDIKKLANSFR